MEILKFVAYALLIIFAAALSVLYSAYNEIKKEQANEEKLDIEKTPYRRKYLLTKNEYGFYKSLKEIADRLNLCVLAKVRLADLVEVSAEVQGKEKLKYFAKIKSKHIDFMLCNKDNLYPELIIELNDNSHKIEKRAQRDVFIEKVLKKAGYKILFVYGSANLEEQIIEKLKKAPSDEGAVSKAD